MRIASLPQPAGTGCESGFRGVVCVSFDSADDTADHDAGGRPRHDLRFTSANPESLSELRSALLRSSVGIRLVLTGSPVDIHAAAAVAAECGLAEEEVTLVSDESGLRVVFCAHCRTRTETVEPIGSEVECQGCATDLEIANHFSRRQAAYLGFAANAEEAA
ncbi:dimethylamine monooxygenase subunit DmmA family protein [Arthrobacter sp. H35-D1]|uniref:dimethylamine monooxygenase subunit DmmA family protein n=1 Tax=Arthrobacter sp. H35-D1 TaxID=3046202 RepID=UPI0024B90955|nr:dimethylamine monooxygenase subunit DmmA family protein [Arthrobacter sp. H35-D1]MDJ0315376.1 dimethylamine monooxygenase subunit DmmA family protein [Arthrobacter sp. H35-D1]